MQTVSEYARKHNVSSATVRRWCEKGRIPAEKIGRAWAILPARPAEARPVEDYIWCVECEAPHAIFGEELNFIGEDRESLACQVPTKVRTLPPDWERTYEAYWNTESPPNRGNRVVTPSYDLYEKSPKTDPAIHRPMYYLEAPDGS